MSHRTNDRAGLRRHGGKAYRRGAAHRRRYVVPYVICACVCTLHGKSRATLLKFSKISISAPHVCFPNQPRKVYKSGGRDGDLLSVTCP